MPICLQFHWVRTAGSKKAGACMDGKFTDLQLKLFDGRSDSPEISCDTCKSLLHTAGFSREDLTDFDLDKERVIDYILIYDSVCMFQNKDGLFVSYQIFPNLNAPRVSKISAPNG